MVARVLHLVRHGEVHNPDGVVYGRLKGFRLSARGEAMAAAAAAGIPDDDVTRIIASPLLRTQQSAAPIAARFGLPVESDVRVIEAGNRFQGRAVSARVLVSPADWPLLRNPLQPSWGEPYTRIVRRMRAAVHDAFDTTESGAAVIVSHQLPIWMTHLSVAGKRLPHDPRHRRCVLSSITTFERHGGELVEVAYAEPAAALLAEAVDRGAT